MSTASTAGCVISVRLQLLLGPLDRVASSKMMSDSARPAEQRRHDAVGLVEGLGDDRLARRAASPSMFTYCEPWPV